jgi:hypothetical protein
MTTMSNPVFDSSLSVFVPPPPVGAEVWSLFCSFLFSLVLWVDWVIGTTIANWQQFAFLPMTLLARLFVVWLDAWINFRHDKLQLVVWMLVVGPLWTYLYVRVLRLWIRGVLWLLCTFWLVAGRRTILGWLLELGLAWLNRSAKAPPAVLRAEDVYVSGVPAPVGHAEGIQFAQAARLTHASVTAGGLTATRCRRRARWVCSLQTYLGGRPGIVGSLVRRRWTPDLPSSDRPVTVNSVLALLDGDAKLLGGGVIRSSDPARHEPFIVLETDNGREVVIPNLLGRLCRNTFGRERDASLLAQLRSRAVEWCADAKVLPCVVPLVVPGHVALALRETAPERLARESLEADGFPLSQGR